MKKIFIMAVAIVALASCKKDYTCECTSTYSSTGNGVPYSDSSTDKYTIKEVSKKTAEANCQSREESSTSGTYASTSKSECKLSKN